MGQFNFIHRDGATPLDENQASGLKFKHLTTLSELDEVEDINIQNGLEWLNSQKNPNYLSIEFLCKLHEKLFGDVWDWAGKFRKADVNLSKISHYDIGPQLKNLFEDAKLWIEAGKMDWDEISAELHHRLVWIHPFPNGNGRTTRIFTEFVQRRNEQAVTSWMESLKDNPLERRKCYINALKKADTGDFSALIEFMKEKKGNKK
jgi:Fic-DOC domain mobile mystery protein B